jgi:branched-chain amino acid transport system ATP-binding protein
MLQICNLTRSFGGLVAVNDVSLDLGTGEILGVIGPNGAGKTTFFNLLSGALRCSSGEITFKGAKSHNLAPHKIAKLGIGRTFQIVRPFGELTVLENILVGLGARFCSGFLSSLGHSRRKQHQSRAREILRQTDLEIYENDKARNLPLGVLRRLEIARALALKPDLLLLDESFSGLSHLEIQSLAAMVRSLRADGIAVILIEHNMQVTMNLCERIVVLEHGSKIADGSPAEIRNNERVIAAYLGSEGHA